LQTDDNVADDFQRIFQARIVVGENREVAQAARDFAHDRALGTVFAAAAAEERNDAPLGLSSRAVSNKILQSVVRVRVIHNDKERLAEHDLLKAAGNAAEIFYA